MHSSKHTIKKNAADLKPGDIYFGNWGDLIIILHVEEMRHYYSTDYADYELWYNLRVLLNGKIVDTNIGSNVLCNIIV
jgi:hypothetical protein